MKRYIYILGFLILLFSCDRRSVEDNQHIIHLTPVYETDNKIDDALKNILLTGDDVSLDTLMFTEPEYGELRYLPFLFILCNEHDSEKASEEIRYWALRDTANLFFLHEMLFKDYEN